MKLTNILNRLLIENIEDMLDLSPTTDLESLVTNLSIIASNSGSRYYVLEWAKEYLSNNMELAKQFKEKYNIKDLSDFEKYMNNVQIKARSKVKKDRRNDDFEYRQAQAMDNIAQIEKMAIDQNAEWEKRIKNREQ